MRVDLQAEILLPRRRSDDTSLRKKKGDQSDYVRRTSDSASLGLRELPQPRELFQRAEI